MLQRVRDLKVQFNNGTLDDERQERRSAPRSAQIAKEVGSIIGDTEVQRHDRLRRTTFTFQVGANDGETISIGRARRSAATPRPAVCRT